MNRRDCLAALVALAAAPLARAQAPEKLRRIGWLSSGSPASHAGLLDGFREGLKEYGWVEGRNIALELRWAEGNLDRLPSLAAELVRLKPDLIVTAANPVHIVARKATSTIPIVMATGADPVSSGLAASFARPGGNVTGLSGFYDELPGKLLEFAAALMPRGARTTVLIDRSVPYLQGEGRKKLENMAKSFQLRAEYVEVAVPQDVWRVLAASGKARPAAFIMLSSPMLFALRDRIVREAAAVKVPVISVYDEMTDAGGLMSYAVDIRQSYRRAAYYVDRILRGAKPGDLPIEQPTRISLAFNLKTARSFGIAIPPTLLSRADRVIE